MMFDCRSHAIMPVHNDVQIIHQLQQVFQPRPVRPLRHIDCVPANFPAISRTLTGNGCAIYRKRPASTSSNSSSSANGSVLR